jgi:NAD+ synthase
MIRSTLEALNIDPEKESAKIADWIRHSVPQEFKRQGLVLGLSGGIDSSTVAGLAAKALGPKKVLGLLMPERHSSDDTLDISRSVAEAFEMDYLHEDITEALEAHKCYERQHDAIRKVLPEFKDDWKFKIVLPDGSGLRYFSVVAETASGEIIKKRLSSKAYLQVVAATNFKQRIRKMFEYYHADRLNYAVAGTPNRLEYDQGFFVKLGDGSADIKPIAHLYKTQVYQIAEFLGVPDSVLNRPPTTDTYSLSQGQDEFYFSLPFDKLDICLFGYNNKLSDKEVMEAAGLNKEELDFVYRDIEQKRRTTRYLHLKPYTFEEGITPGV